jgi:hypothetical protein
MTTKKAKTEKNMPATVLVLRCCAADMTSQNGFKWPGVGEVAECPDWIDNAECGNGLHGWLYGQGDHTTASYYENEGAKWLVVEVEFSTIRMLGGKVKFPRGTVRFVGQKHEAAAYLIEHEAQAKNVAVIGASLTVGDGAAVIVGALGTATAGDRGTATAGDSGTATAGDLGTATAGDRGTATAGYSGTATAGALGTATAGYSGEIRIRWWDDKHSRYRAVIGYVGEAGIEANVPYRLNDKHELVKA